MTATVQTTQSPATTLAQTDPIIPAKGYPRKHSVPTPWVASTNPSDQQRPPLPDAEISSLTLDNKPGAHIHYTYYPASQSHTHHPNPFSQTLIVFLNGLLSTRTSWDPTIQAFLEKRILAGLPYPALVSYDRYGQGQSDRDPEDREPPPCHGHDLLSAVKALKQFTLQIWRDHNDPLKPTHYPCLIFVGNSIGCAMARVFTQSYPGTVSGLLFLDSIMAHSDQQSFWPDPDAPDFNPLTLPDGVTQDQVRDTRQKYASLFGPNVPNMEGLSRRNLAHLLPRSDHPPLQGYLGTGPYLTVVGHDWETFAEESFRGPLQIPKILTMTYANPAWQRYNEGLVHITDPGRAIGPITAVHCGHFIQRDDPRFVSDEMVSLLDRVVDRGQQVRERD